MPHPPTPGMRRGSATLRRYCEVRMSAAIMGRPSSGQFATPLRPACKAGPQWLAQPACKISGSRKRSRATRQSWHQGRQP